MPYPYTVHVLLQLRLLLIVIYDPIWDPEMATIDRNDSFGVINYQYCLYTSGVSTEQYG